VQKEVIGRPGLKLQNNRSLAHYQFLQKNITAALVKSKILTKFPAKLKKFSKQTKVPNRFTQKALSLYFVTNKCKWPASWIKSPFLLFQLIAFLFCTEK